MLNKQYRNLTEPLPTRLIVGESEWPLCVGDEGSPVYRSPYVHLKAMNLFWWPAVAVYLKISRGDEEESDPNSDQWDLVMWGLREEGDCESLGHYVHPTLEAARLAAERLWTQRNGWVQTDDVGPEGWEPPTHEGEHGCHATVRPRPDPGGAPVPRD